MPASPYRKAFEIALSTNRSLRTAADQDHRMHLLDVQAAALMMLDEYEPRRRRSTEETTGRIAKLEKLFAKCEPGERAAAICQRLGISRARYYALRPDSR